MTSNYITKEGYIVDKTKITPEKLETIKKFYFKQISINKFSSTMLFDF